MNIFKKTIVPLALSAAFLASSILPSQAFNTVPVPKFADRSGLQSADVVDVQYRNDWRRPGYHRRGNDAYYNGHRGYSERRDGYRRHNGAWFPLAAFATGAIIGGAIADRPVRYGGSHTEWCLNRYRSYRVSDNSYQPNNGSRRICNSPY